MAPTVRRAVSLKTLNSFGVDACAYPLASLIEMSG